MILLTRPKLLSTTSELMVQGGDGRLFVFPDTGVNKYNTAPVPDTAIVRSSCTSSPPTCEAFAEVRRLHQKLLASGSIRLF